MSEWVDCAKKMPPNKKDVILYIPRGDDHIPFQEIGSHDRGVWVDAHGFKRVFATTPSHWMPLPAKPVVKK